MSTSGAIDAGRDTDAEAGTDPDADSDTDAEAGTDPDPASDPDSDSASGSVPVTEPDPVSDPDAVAESTSALRAGQRGTRRVSLVTSWPWRWALLIGFALPDVFPAQPPITAGSVFTGALPEAELNEEPPNGG